jgi:hypothetical protein
MEKDANNEPKWMRYADNIDCIAVTGGLIYRTIESNDISTTFVPDLDLHRYQEHLKDAYHQGYRDGREWAEDHKPPKS